MSEEGFGRALKIFIEHASYEGSASNSSDDCNGTNHTLEHEDHGGHANSGTVLFLFAAFAVGGKPHPLIHLAIIIIKFIILVFYSLCTTCAEAHAHPIHCYPDYPWPGLWSSFKCGGLELSTGLHWTGQN